MDSRLIRQVRVQRRALRRSAAGSGNLQLGIHPRNSKRLEAFGINYNLVVGLKNKLGTLPCQIYNVMVGFIMRSSRSVLNDLPLCSI